MIKPLEKRNLGEDATSQLRELIIFGEIPPQTKLVERELGAKLQTSRTPVRDALKNLQGEGFIRQQGKSFQVVSFDSDEIDEIYPLIANIESFLLSGISEYSAKRIEKLRAINRAMKNTTGNIKKQIALDIQWHSVLIEDINLKASRILTQLRHLASRYDYAYFRLRGHSLQSFQDHDAIIDYLEKLDFSSAKRELLSHWLSDLEEFKEAFDEAAN